MLTLGTTNSFHIEKTKKQNVVTIRTQSPDSRMSAVHLLGSAFRLVRQMTIS